MIPTDLKRSILSQLTYERISEFKNFLDVRLEVNWLPDVVNELLIVRMGPECFLKFINNQEKNQPRNYGKFTKIQPHFGLIFSKHDTKENGCFCEGLSPYNICRILTIHVENIIFFKVINGRYITLPIVAGFFVPKLKNLEIDYIRVNKPKYCDLNDIPNADKYVQQLHSFMDYHRMENKFQSLCMIVVVENFYDPVIQAIEEFLKMNKHRSVAVWGIVKKSSICMQSRSTRFQNFSYCSVTFDCTVIGVTAPQLSSFSIVLQLTDLNTKVGKKLFARQVFVFKIKIHLEDALKARKIIALMSISKKNQKYVKFILRVFRKQFKNIPIIGTFENTHVIGRSSYAKEEEKLVHCNAVSFVLMSLKV